MSIQDKFERILRDLLVMVSKAQASKKGSAYVLVHKKEMQRQLGSLRDVVQEMMNEYEATEESRNRRMLEAQKQREQIIRNANHQAQDIYAASVLYTEEALRKIQSIIDEAELASKNTLDRLRREMEEERRRVRSNQNELLIQLEDLKDTAKYMRLIEDRNREIAKAKAKKEENLKPRKYNRKSASDTEAQTEENEADEAFVPIRPEIRINEEYFKKAGYMRDNFSEETLEDTSSGDPLLLYGGNGERPADMQEDMSEEIAAEIVAGIAREISAELPAEQAGDLATPYDNEEDKIVYEKPVIKINQEYFEKIKNQNASGKKQSAKEESDAFMDDRSENKGKRQGFFPFGRKT